MGGDIELVLTIPDHPGGIGGGCRERRFEGIGNMQGQHIVVLLQVVEAGQFGLGDA